MDPPKRLQNGILECLHSKGNAVDAMGDDCVQPGRGYGARIGFHTEFINPGKIQYCFQF